MLSAHLTHYEYFPSIYPLHLAEWVSLMSEDTSNY
jgi:hypothetical protein